MRGMKRNDEEWMIKGYKNVQLTYLYVNPSLNSTCIQEFVSSWLGDAAGCCEGMPRNLREKEREMDHFEELVNESCVHQVMQDCSLLFFHQSPEKRFDKLSRLPLDP